MKRRVLAMVLVGVLALGLMAGCGKKGADKGGNSGTDVEISYWHAGLGDEWLEVFCSYHKKSVTISKIIIHEDCLSSFIEFLKSHWNEEIDMPESIHFIQCSVPYRLKADIHYITQHFDFIHFDTFSTSYY